MARGYVVADPGAATPPAPASFIGSFCDEPDQALIVLCGDIDAATVHRLGLHIDACLAVSTIRFITINAGAVDRYDAALLDLLGRTQHRLGRVRGLLRVRGLHPGPVSDPAPAAQVGAVAGAAAVASPQPAGRAPERVS